MKVRKISATVMVSLLAMAFLCQCKTVRTEGATHSTKYSIAGRTAGESDDSKKIREKYGNHGWNVDKDGNFTAKKDNLYGDSRDAGSKSRYKTGDAKLGKSDFNTKAFNTPEYLKMQDYKGTGDAREDGNLAREGNFKKSRWNSEGKLFRSKSKAASQYAAYDTGTYTKDGKKFGTGNNRSTMKALTNAPIASGTLESTGYRENSSLTMDDVKKMLSPNSYSRGTGLVN